MIQCGRWWLPDADAYFAPYVAGEDAPFRDGFQRDHLLAALPYVRDWRCAVDVGAHVGFWTGELTRRFARVVAFEPAPDCFACLARNVEGAANVVLVNAAVGAAPGRAQMVDDAKRVGNTGSRYLRPIKDGTGAAGDGVPVVALDDRDDLVACDLLKIDVEGFELAVLRGAARLIRRHRPVIVMETDKKFDGRFGFRPGAARALLAAWGYRAAVHLRPDTVFVPRETRGSPDACPMS